MNTEPKHVTALLERWRSGDEDAFEDLVPLVYSELRRLARGQLRREGNPTIQPTELVAEAYIKLLDVNAVDWQGRAHFYSMAARVMRRVLVDRFRRRNAARRNQGMSLVTLVEGSSGTTAKELDFEALEDALQQLAELDPRQAEIVTMRFFGGLTGDEIAEVLKISPRTVKREWATARIFLYRALKES